MCVTHLLLAVSNKLPHQVEDAGEEVVTMAKFLVMIIERGGEKSDVLLQSELVLLPMEQIDCRYIIHAPEDVPLYIFFLPVTFILLVYLDKQIGDLLTEIGMWLHSSIEDAKKTKEDAEGTEVVTNIL